MQAAVCYYHSVTLDFSLVFHCTVLWRMFILVTLDRECSAYYRGADKSLARPERTQTRKHVRDARDFNNIEPRADI